MNHSPATWVGRLPGADGVITLTSPTVHEGVFTFDVPGVGRFDQTLHRVLPFSPEDFRARIGEYTDGDITIVVTMHADDTTGAPFPFYADVEHGALVPLYPIAPDRMMSQQGEDLVFGDETVTLSVDGCEASLFRSPRIVTEEVSFPVSGSNAVLSGTLLRPIGTDPVPAVAMAHGAAAHQRDYYRIFAHAIVRSGFAVLMFDRQGYGSSTGEPDTSLRGNAAGLEAALDFLTSREDIGPVGLWGFSNGMWTVPLVTARRPDVAFVAGVSAPGVSAVDSEVHRRTTALRQAGVAESAVDLAARTWQTLLGAGAGETVPAARIKKLDGWLAKLRDDESVQSFRSPGYAVSAPHLSPMPPLDTPGEALVKELSADPDPGMSYDPVNSYREIGCPVLLQYGPLDLNLPAERSAERITAALRDGGNEELTVHSYPGAGHLLETVNEDVEGRTYEEVSYGFHRFRFASGAVADQAAWFARIAESLTNG